MLDLASMDIPMAQIDLADRDMLCGWVGPLPNGLAVMSVAVHYNGQYWASVPTFPSTESHDVGRIFTCQLPPVPMPMDGLVELFIVGTTSPPIAKLNVRRTVLANPYGLPASEVFSLDSPPLFSVPWIHFDGMRLVVTGTHLPPQGDPAKLGVEFGPGVNYHFESPLASPDFAKHYWYWPNAHLAHFRITIDLTSSAPGADPFRFRMVYNGAQGTGEADRAMNYIPMDLRAFVGHPTDPTQLTRVQTFSDSMTVTTSGYQAFRMMEALMTQYGIDPEGDVRILDWGCGHGRVTRHFTQNWPAAEIHGTDIDAENVGWCTRNLANGHFTKAPLWPPTSLPAEHYDAIFAISVMTHLTAEAQEAWLSELHRILKPGGLALLTFAGVSATAFSSVWRDPAWWSRWKSLGFDDHQYDPALTGKIGDEGYYRNTLQTTQNIVATWSTHFEILAVHEAMFGYQDVAILRRRG